MTALTDRLDAVKIFFTCLVDNIITNEEIMRTHAENLAGPLTTRDALLVRLAKYGFLETNSICFFLKAICDSIPDRASCYYIREKLTECLDMHDDGGKHFNELHKILKDVDYILNLKVEI